MAIGALIELAFIRWLSSPSLLRMIIITIGVSILIREAAHLVWGQDVRSLPYFTGNEVTTLAIGGARISPQVLWALGACAAMVALITVFFRSTMLGRQMRACASNRVAASLCGLPTRNLVTLSFMLSAGMGALAGCVVSPITYTQYAIGTGLAIKGFTVAILGGLGNSLAAVAAGLVLGVLEAFSVSLLPTAYKDAISIAVLLGILFVRPSGLFAARWPPGPRIPMAPAARSRSPSSSPPRSAVQLLARPRRRRRFLLTQLTMSAHYTLAALGLSLLMGYAGQISLGQAGFFALGGYASAVLTTWDLSAHRGDALVAAARRGRRAHARARTSTAARCWSFTRGRPSGSRWHWRWCSPSRRHPGPEAQGPLPRHGHAGGGHHRLQHRPRDRLARAPPTGSPGSRPSPSCPASPWAAAPRRGWSTTTSPSGCSRSRCCSCSTWSSRGSGARCAPSTAPRTPRAPWASTRPATSSGPSCWAPALAAVAGVFLTHYNGGIGPSEASVMKSVKYLSIVAVGGMGSLWGTVCASLVLNFLSLRGYFGTFDDAVFGGILIVVMLFAPDGILTLHRGRLSGLLRRRAPAEAAPVERESDAAARDLGAAPAVRLDEPAREEGLP